MLSKSCLVSVICIIFFYYSYYSMSLLQCNSMVLCKALKDHSIFFSKVDVPVLMDGPTSFNSHLCII